MTRAERAAGSRLGGGDVGAAAPSAEVFSFQLEDRKQVRINKSYTKLASRHELVTNQSRSAVSMAALPSVRRRHKLEGRGPNLSLRVRTTAARGSSGTNGHIGSLLDEVLAGHWRLAAWGAVHCLRVPNGRRVHINQPTTVLVGFTAANAAAC